MPGKIARSTFRPPFGPPVVWVAARSSRLASRQARKSLLFTPVRESSGECRLKAVCRLLQMFGAACLIVVVLTHVAETLDLFPSMGWGQPNSPGHYLDLISAILGGTL